MVNTRPKLRPFHHKSALRNLAKYLQAFSNKGWQYMTKVRLEQGDKVGDEYEGYLRFLDSLVEECKQLSW